MESKAKNGLFQVIDSFVIKRRNEFYLIGEMKEGTVEEQWFINVSVNGQLSLTFKITQLEEVEIISERNKKYTLLIVTGDTEDLDFLLTLNIGNELLDVTADGVD